MENAGDPWNFTNGQHLDYFECLYFLVVGMRIPFNMLLRVLVLLTSQLVFVDLI